jgi:hypothetical protein
VPLGPKLKILMDPSDAVTFALGACGVQSEKIPFASRPFSPRLQIHMKPFMATKLKGSLVVEVANGSAACPR